jgi:eukaryotic-like serine/threonine-protein kinase
MMFNKPVRVVGRYLVCTPLASGGMATVHLGRLLGLQGFTRTVAIKQLHPQFARDPEFVSMFLDEAKLASRIHHPNVVAPLDVVALEGEIFIVMEYVHGEALSRLMDLAGTAPLPAPIACSILIQVLLGLHAAHEATDERGNALSIVHRDVSPQNILLGEDGQAKVVDFGIAKAARRVHSTADRKLKGKLGYMSPEQLRLQAIDRRSDVFSAGIVLWELLTGHKLFPFGEPAAVVAKMLEFQPQAPSVLQRTISPELDQVVLRALQIDPEQRFQDARAMATELKEACAPAGVLDVAAWVVQIAGPALGQRAAWVADAESITHAGLTQTRPVRDLTKAPGGPLPASGSPKVRDELGLQDSTEPLSLDARALTGGTSEVATVAEPRPRRRKRRLALAGALLVLAGTSAAAVIWRAKRLEASNEPPTVTVLAGEPALPLAATHPPAPVPSSAQSVARGAPAPSVPAEPSAAELDPRPLPATPEPRPSTTSTRGASFVRSSKRSGAAPSAASSTAPSTAPNKLVPCAVPYTVDANGIKRFRPECF